MQARQPVATDSRQVSRIVTARRQLEGGGFPVRRPFPGGDLMNELNPFLLLDEMGPVEYAPGEALGAPDHPHRGFETVTYMLQGTMQHRDSHGHAGDLPAGSVQWMTAGAGIVHAEMPHPAFQASGGVMHGFQLWVNLPAADKMMSPRYQDVPATRIPAVSAHDGRVQVRVIAGQALGVSAVIDTVIPITYLHFTLAPGGRVTQPLAAGQVAFAHVFGGAVTIGNDGTRVEDGQLAILSDGDDVHLAVPAAATDAAELLLLAAPRLDEAVVRHGPFVMNTKQEIEQALRDYRDGKMGEITPEVSTHG